MHHRSHLELKMPSTHDTVLTLLSPLSLSILSLALAMHAVLVHVAYGIRILASVTRDMLA